MGFTLQRIWSWKKRAPRNKIANIDKKGLYIRLATNYNTAEVSGFLKLICDTPY